MCAIFLISFSLHSQSISTNSSDYITIEGAEIISVNSDFDINSVPKSRNTGTIFVLGGAKLYDASLAINESPSPKNSLKKTQYCSLSEVKKEDLVTKTPKKASVKSLARLETKAYKKAKEIQNKLSKTVQVHYCPNSTDKNSVQMGSRDGNGVVITNTDHSFKFAKALVSVAKITPNFEGQITKQKYYTSLSFLQFGKYRSSSLRAPPIFS